jgi:hypothetical protein
MSSALPRKRISPVEETRNTSFNTLKITQNNVALKHRKTTDSASAKLSE